jgi:hypothetical protein
MYGGGCWVGVVAPLLQQEGRGLLQQSGADCPWACAGWALLAQPGAGWVRVRGGVVVPLKTREHLHGVQNICKGMMELMGLRQGGGNGEGVAQLL